MERYVYKFGKKIDLIFFLKNLNINLTFDRRSINPPNMNNKPRNGPLSPRDHRERDYIHYNSMNNHHHSSHNNSSHHHHSPQQHHHHHHQQQQQPPPPQQNYHPNSDLINFVSSAWKEKVIFFKKSKLQGDSNRFHFFRSHLIRQNISSRLNRKSIASLI